MRVPSNRVLHLGWKIDNVQHGAFGFATFKYEKVEEGNFVRISKETQKFTQTKMRQTGDDALFQKLGMTK